MAKEKKVEEAVVEAVPEKKSDQKVRWEIFLAKHKAQNPEKHAAREKAGELVMPANF